MRALREAAFWLLLITAPVVIAETMPDRPADCR